jgi:predicted transposase/invertase (TIGR01784 family)
MKFADPKNDLAFKKIFGNSQHKNILISFLNSVLDFKDGKVIVEVELANPYQVPKIPELKETILDIQATNRNGEKFIVEMQRKDLGNFTKRSLYYTSKAYVEQLPKGNDYTSLKKVYFIGIVNFEIFTSTNFISRHLIINQESNKQDLDDFEFTFIELPKFNKALHQLENILDKWIYFIKNAQDLTLIPQEYENREEFLDAFEVAKQTSWNSEELKVYEYMALKEFDEVNALRTAEKKGYLKGEQRGLEKGMEQGLEQGLEKGMEKGLEQGLEQGKEAEKMEIAKNSISQGLDNNTIAMITGLDINMIESLRD